MHSSYQPALWLVKATDTHAYLMLSKQPWKCYALVLSLTNKYLELIVLFYNYASGVVFPTFNIYQKPNIVTYIIAVLCFSSLKYIGYDLTISFTKYNSPPQHHTNSYHQIKNLPTKWQPADHIIATAMSEPSKPPHYNVESAPSTVIKLISSNLEPESESESEPESESESHAASIWLLNDAWK